MKKAYVERTLKPGAHTLDEVMTYLVKEHGFVEPDKEIHQYYGVTEEDIRTMSQRYKDVVRALCRK